MPTFGLSDEEAESVAAWLWHVNHPPQLAAPQPVKADKKSPPLDGETIIQSVGCLACHKVGELGESGPYGGGDLSNIGDKRSDEWLYTWLFQPDRINAQRRMPVIKLTPTERSQVVAALKKLGRTGETSFDPPRFERNTELVEQGRLIATRSRCFNCHRTPATEIDRRGLPTLTQPVKDWKNSCLADAPDRSKGRPHYPQVDADALKAYVNFRASHAAQPADEAHGSFALSEFDEGKLVLQRRNCLACHERDGGRGIVPIAGQAASTIDDLRGQSEALIPPNLTAVGDKLKDAPLAEAVAGEQKSIRMPWLKVRMPTFNHEPEERAALVSYLIGHDRIPDGAPTHSADDPHQDIASKLPADDTKTLLIGRQLVGVGGFSCIACHSVGDYEPRNVALGTRGSNLKGIGDRMRPEFFARWTRSPLRIVPGMEMPSYEKPAPKLLDENVHAQLAALWSSLNDPRFEAPTNPTQVEQLLSVQPGEPPQIVRDVFTVSKENAGGYVARSFAVGFDNGHSLLFDLDKGCVREWTFGDFARQRTEGKSWFWDLAGAPLLKDLGSRSEFVLRRGDQWIPLDADSPPHVADLRRYSVEPLLNEVRLEYDLHVPGRDRQLHVRETIKPLDDSRGSERTGLARHFDTEGLQESETLWLVPVSGSPLLLNAAIQPGHEWHPCGDLGAGVDITVRGSVLHVADAAPLPAAPPPRPEVPTNSRPVASAPGFEGIRLPLPAAIMPTALNWTRDGRLAFTSLKGQVYLTRDSDGDGLPDALTQFENGLAAPFGLLDAGPSDDDEPVPALELLVVHKPELLRLIDEDGDGVCDRREVVAAGWGYTDNYHDWTNGPVRDSNGNLYVATSSDYAQPGRPEFISKWRGKILKIDPRGRITPIAHELRYPIGIAFNPEGELFVSDQQGVANTFNEIDHIQQGRRYGVKGLYDPDTEQPETRAAVQVPHPLTRSVNGIFFIPEGETPLAPFAGHGIGCEYNGKFLIRFSLQAVEGELQGATYLFTKNDWPSEKEMFLGPICGGVSPAGDIYVGSIHDSGWLGGMNTGEIVRLRPTGKFPNGIREIRAIPGGFEIEFLRAVDPKAAAKPENYALSGYTRVWQGSYATEDSGQYQPKIQSIDVAEAGRIVRLHVDRLEPSYVYDIAVSGLARNGEELFPSAGHYTMNRVPAASGK
jgi:hypothetical protein